MTVGRDGLRAFQRDDGGQQVVLVALMLTLLIGFMALAMDAGRVYVEQRYLRNAADAAALACAGRLASGGTAVQAEATGYEILVSYNLRANPVGAQVTPPNPAIDPDVYDGWFNGINNASDKRNLANGVVAGTNNCRVGLEAPVRLFFIPVVNPNLSTAIVKAHAHAKMKGGMLPIVVNRFDNPPGPGGNPAFHDYIRQEASDSNCDDNDADGDIEGVCPIATNAAPGRERVIVGQGYVASDSDFRGFIALDVRDFADRGGLHKYYNNTLGMNQQTLKDKEAAYVSAGGYPGPDLVAYDPGAPAGQIDLQVATMSGNTTGVVVDAFKKYFKVGDRILVQLFDGQVREIPDFNINQPSTINVATSQANSPGPTFRVGANQNFRDDGSLVTLRLLRDWYYDALGTEVHASPDGLQGPTAQNDRFTFAPGTTSPTPLQGCPNSGCFVPAGGSGTQVDIGNVEVNPAVPAGIYSIIIQGHGYTSTGTLFSERHAYVPLNVGDVLRDYTMSFASGTAEVALDQPAVFTFQLIETGAGGNPWGNQNPANLVYFSIDYRNLISTGSPSGFCTVGQIELRGGNLATPTTHCFGSGFSISPVSALPLKPNQNPTTVTVTIPTVGLPAGTYYATFRARGVNVGGTTVEHLQELIVAVGTTAGGAKKYVNVRGYAVFQIVTCTITNDANAVCGRAVTRNYDDPNHPDLIIGKKPFLVPWEIDPYN